MVLFARAIKGARVLETACASSVRTCKAVPFHLEVQKGICACLGAALQGRKFVVLSKIERKKPCHDLLDEGALRCEGQGVWLRRCLQGNCV